jgi:hypothetical protein
MTIDGCNISEKDVLSMGPVILNKEAGPFVEHPTNGPAFRYSAKGPMTGLQMFLIFRFAPDQ